MNAIVNGVLVLRDRLVTGQALLYSDKIEGLVPTDQVPAGTVLLDAGGGYVMPGLIDLHIHGYAGVDATTAAAEELVQMGHALLKTGVTGFLATTMTADTATLEAAWDACRRAMGRCANLLGVNAEGPFISPAKCGAQDPAYAVPPEPAWMADYADVIRLTTIAPEWPGAADGARALSWAGITVAVGHTAADYDTVMRSIRHGATHATHLFNAMSGLNHRAPGAVEAVLNSPASCELIADNHHVHPALYEPVYKVKGNALCLVTDCLAAGGLPAGEYTLGGAPVVSDGVLCRRRDGTLAGSAGTLMNNLKNFWEATHIPLWECVGCATANPAHILGLATRKGALEPGKDADIVVATKELTVTATILGGETIYTA